MNAEPVTVIEVSLGYGGWYINLVDGENGKNLATTEAYDSRANADRAAEMWQRRLAGGAKIRTKSMGVSITGDAP